VKNEVIMQYKEALFDNLTLTYVIKIMTLSDFQKVLVRGRLRVKKLWKNNFLNNVFLLYHTILNILHKYFLIYSPVFRLHFWGVTVPCTLI